MRVMFDVTDPDERKRTMTEKKGKAEAIDVKALLARDEAFIRAIVKAALQEVLEAEMAEVVGAAKGRADGDPAGISLGRRRPDVDHAGGQAGAPGAAGPRRPGL